MLWFGQRESRRVPPCKGDTFTTVQQFERNVQEGGDVARFFTFLIIEKRPVIDGLCGYFCVRPGSFCKARCDRRDRGGIEPSTHENNGRTIGQTIAHCTIQKIAILVEILLFALVLEQVFHRQSRGSTNGETFARTLQYMPGRQPANPFINRAAFIQAPSRKQVVSDEMLVENACKFRRESESFNGVAEADHPIGE